MAGRLPPNEHPMSEPLVIIGNGMAAAKLCEELVKSSLGRYAVAVVGEEPRLAYNRVLLSSLLADEIESAELELKSARWWQDRGVTLIYGCPATSIDTAIRRIRLANGATLPYTKLVLATGSRPIRLTIPGAGLRGVLTFRDVADVAAIRAAAGGGKRAVVIGGGLLGLEAAHGLAKAGASVTVIHLMDRLMERQLDARASALLRRELEGRDVTVLTQAETARIDGATKVEAVMLKDGRVVAADIVVVAVGVRPSVDLARTAGVAINRGIVVNDRLETDITGIHAIGECAEHRGQCYGLVEPAYEQGRVLARRLAGEDAHYAGSVTATNLKVSGVNVFSAGDFLGSPGSEEVVLSDPGLGTYKKLVITSGKLTGVVLFGDTTDGLWYLELIRSDQSIAALRDDLIFGRALALPAAA
jgi:nitrite reductase (NADH) large subunit